MDQPSKRRDLTEKNVKEPVKSSSEEWKKQALYKMPTDKPRPESTSAAAQGSIPYRNGRLQLLARQRLQRNQSDSYVPPTPRANQSYWHPRQGSDVKHKLNESNSNPSALGVPKGDRGSTNPPVRVAVNQRTLGHWGQDRGAFGLPDSDSSSQQQCGCCCWPWQRR